MASLKAYGCTGVTDFLGLTYTNILREENVLNSFELYEMVLSSNSNALSFTTVVHMKRAVTNYYMKTEGHSCPLCLVNIDVEHLLRVS